MNILLDLNSPQKNKYIGRAAIWWLLVILLIPGNILPATSQKPVLADSESLKWTQVDTPGTFPDRNDVVSPCEVNRITIGSDGRTFYAVDIANPNSANGSKSLYKSTDSGVSWDDIVSRHLYQAMTPAEQLNFRIWNIAVAPDDVNFVAVVTNDNISNLPRNVWFSRNGGFEWQDTDCPAADNISAVDISSRYGGRDIAIGTRTGIGSGTIWVLKAPEYNDWVNQGSNGDALSLKFSPNYDSDATIAIVYADTTGTYLNLGIHDLHANTTDWAIVYGGSPPEVTAGAPGSSPKSNQVISADLQLPGDFSGQALSLRRCYISTDDGGVTGNGGIYRIDDTVAHQLLSAATTKRISSIAYFGNYASGKLLAGEALGDPCSATVMTWFTDSPTTCPIPCWYPAMKPLTGAAGTDNCTGSGSGNTQVDWSPDGSIAYAGTASSAALMPGANWPVPYLTGEELDESAFSLTRNNGETWNQLALIDTKISRLVDIAPTPDCSNVYLASVSYNVGCSGFDSVWRSQGSPAGGYWERVLCIPTTGHGCAAGQTDLAILRLSGDKADGQVVFWAAVGTRRIMWSLDYGDYWTNTINPTLPVQGMAAEDSHTLYILSANGLVQKFTYSGTGWIPHAPVLTGLDTGYSITTAFTGLTPDNDEGQVIVGGSGTGSYDVAYSTDGGNTFMPITAQLPTRGNTMVVASSSYKSSGELFAINTGGMYEWSIYYGGGTWSYPLPEKDKWSLLWGGPDFPTAVTGLTISRNGGFYFSDAFASYVRWSLAGAGLDPLVSFGTEPTTRLRICGALASAEPVTIWLIDQRPYSPLQGGVWKYIDDLSWNGPTPTSPVSNTAVKYDPVSGRAGQLDLMWKAESLSKGYRIQIAKDQDFTLQIADIGATYGGPFYIPPDLDSPALVIPPGGGKVIDDVGNSWTVPALEAGHTYYWRVMVQDVATGDDIQSPWSWREIFTIQTGLPVTPPYCGLQLLSPDNGCIHYPVKSATFSWLPIQDAKKYRFILAEDTDMTNVIVETELPTTSYTYDTALNYGTTYFWKVMAVEPVPGEWSATFCFQTEGTPVSHPEPYPASPVPFWVWVIIVCGALLDISLLILVLRRLL
jgi:hypothetical protein